MLASLSILASAAPDISSVPADFVKNFLIMAAFVAAVYGGRRWGLKSSGKADDPLHLKQPLEITKAPRYAHKRDTEAAIAALNAKVESMARENLRSHNQTAAKINQVIEGGAQRETNIIKAMGDMEARITSGVLKECKDMHLRINPLAETQREHHAAIAALQKRGEELWAYLGRVWDHVTKKGSK